MSVPDTREIKDNEGPAGERADDAGGGARGSSWAFMAQLGFGDRTGTGTWQMETVDGELGMVQVAMAVVEIGAWQWR